LNSLWVIEANSSFYRGVALELKSAFTLRHLLTGKVLSVEEVELNEEVY